MLDYKRNIKAMKKLECDCGFVARGETDEEVMDNMLEHVEERHPDKIAEMSEGEMIGMFREKITTE
jgi:predicted small metal-binding protein